MENSNTYDISFKIKELISERSHLYLKNDMLIHFTKLHDEIESSIFELNDIAVIGESTLLQDVIEELKKLKFKISELIEGLNRPFELFIVGMGKFGKSTLINALLEQEAAEVGVLPKTWKIDVYDATLPPHECIIIFDDGVVKKASYADTREFVKIEEEKIGASRKIVKQNLAKMISDLTSKEQILEAEKLLKKKYLYQSKVVEIRWPIVSNNISKRFRIVDTPGLVQENLSGNMMISIQEYYHKADGVIWLLDATKVASKDSKSMLAEIETSIRKIGGNTDNIIAAVNRMDLIRRNGNEDIEKIKEETEKIFGNHFKGFTYISAKEAFESSKTQDKSMKNLSGINSLNLAIQENFYKNARKFQIQSRLMGFIQTKHEMFEESNSVQVYIKRLKRERKAFVDRLKGFTKRMDEMHNKFNEELQTILESKRTIVLGNIERDSVKLFDIEDKKMQQNYIMENLFNVNEISSDLNKLVEYHQSKVESYYKEFIEEKLFREYIYIEPNLSKEISMLFSYSVKNENLNLTELSYASGAGFAFIGGLLLGPAGLLIGGVASILGINKSLAKLFKSSSLKKELESGINNYLEKTKESVSEHFENNMEQITKSAINDLKSSFRFLHSDFEQSEMIVSTLEDLNKALNQQVKISTSIKHLIAREKKLLVRGV